MLGAAVVAGGSAHGSSLDSILLGRIACTSTSVLILIITMRIQQVEMLDVLLNGVRVVVSEVCDPCWKIESGFVRNADCALLS